MSRASGADLDAGLKRLHLPTIRRTYATVFAEAEKESWTHREVLGGDCEPCRDAHPALDAQGQVPFSEDDRGV